MLQRFALARHHPVIYVRLREIDLGGNKSVVAPIIPNGCEIASLSSFDCKLGDLARVSAITIGAVPKTIAEETGGSGEFAFFWRSFSRLDAGTIAHGRSKSSECVLGRFGQAISTRSPLHAGSGAEMARKAWTEQRSRGLRSEAGNLE